MCKFEFTQSSFSHVRRILWPCVYIIVLCEVVMRVTHCCMYVCMLYPYNVNRCYIGCIYTGVCHAELETGQLVRTEYIIMLLWDCRIQFNGQILITVHTSNLALRCCNCIQGAGVGVEGRGRAR